MSQDMMNGQTGDQVLGNPQQDLEIKSFQAPTGRFVCDCGKSYMRKEHLKRHQATHNSQAHQCHICGQSYLRKDVLQRHLTTHQDPSAKPRACEACRANKTKCDGNGVSDCSFCKNKAIACTYSLRRSRMRKGALPEKHDEKPLKDNPPSTAPIRQPIPKARLANIREAMSQSSLAEARSKSYRNALPPSVSSAETASESNSSDSPNYLITILQQLSALPPRSAPLQVKDASDSEKQWLEDNFRSYADHFHHRWHVITAATYDFSEKPFDNAASVIMIGSYFSSKENRNSVCLGLHRKLVDQYTKLLQEEIVAKANSLCDLFIETLRVTGFLNQSYAQEVLQNEFPGSYSPWVGMFTDEWKRLVCNLFKVETRISLNYRQRPRLHYNELKTSLTSPFSVRNCYDMDVFVRRQRCENAGRDIDLSSMIKHPNQFLPNPLLIEDIHLGLCGLTVEVLEREHTRGISNISANAATDSVRDSVLERLATWLVHIEDITQKLSSDVSNPTEDSLSVNYLAREDEIQALSSARVVVRQRIQDILSDTMTVCHRLQILLSTTN
ncbi:hypothetical protein FOXG_17662 [Fusarium oxysporum f. sp. lycopersici 4287]|uniref:Uncharacterized protein n=1 Tax=Fusarium oxysporum f. sp. lycopersici (strain 4287 / CBS 123668 / FGSC 9935 / NRRL 34936) TaxID=426428 RepID=A0A0J9WDK3_FUSO4|nr:uncharacterized protein FOXG_17662 [Fusarium oxysporum f. sp. lycopersici 4287]KNB20735.1 hypothetical protein FOXG_17662 [Fusarium oxysporum f. sp. lycopersici 4287]